MCKNFFCIAERGLRWIKFKCWNIISTSHQFWTDHLILPCVAICLSYPLDHSLLLDSFHQLRTVLLWQPKVLLFVGCYARGINSLLKYFFKCFMLFKSIMPSHKFLMSNSFRIISIKINIMKVIIINIYTKNIQLITRNTTLPKFLSTKTISQLKNITSSRFTINFFHNIPTRHKFNIGRKASTALSHIYWVLYLSRQHFSIKGSSETTLSHIFCVLYQSGTELNSKEEVSTA